MAAKKILIVFTRDEEIKKNIKDTVLAVDEIKKALVAGGFEVEARCLTEEDFKDVGRLKRKIFVKRPDCIFNLFEGFVDDSSKEIELVRIIESEGLPYTGNGSMALENCLDKAACKKILKEAGVSVPRGIFINKSGDFNLGDLAPPFFVKPCFEDASYGIDEQCLVYEEKELASVIERALEMFPRGIVVEEFIGGKEYHVGLLGEYPYELLGISTTDYSLYKDFKPFLTYKAKWDRNTPEYRRIMPSLIEPIEGQIENKLHETASFCAKALGCKGYLRVDIREKRGGFFVLDVNPNPDISVESGFIKQAYQKGYDYQKIIVKIVQLANIGPGETKCNR
ncbi:MAG: ATP-grasp domain-containing protein [Candidatus Omnitrophica bacterium]|nr:ATP-grasp domain-containing protein [Candidatus Omnitrophota bacterium]MDD5429678.1 ATP-grasp domain-containing protein [Candidatus Omnitrophota bacterium]